MLVARERVSFLAGPPTFFVAIAARWTHPGDWVPGSICSSIRLVSSGGASVTPAFVEETAGGFHCRVKVTYGFHRGADGDDQHQRRPLRPGHATPTVEPFRSDRPPAWWRSRPAARCVGTGGSGRLSVRGPEVFAGYADPRSENAAVIAAGGWFRTGDLASGGTRRDGSASSAASRTSSSAGARTSRHRRSRRPSKPTPPSAKRWSSAIPTRSWASGWRPTGVDRTTPSTWWIADQWFAERGMAKFRTPERVERLARLPLLGSGKPTAPPSSVWPPRRERRQSGRSRTSTHAPPTLHRHRTRDRPVAWELASEICPGAPLIPLSLLAILVVLAAVFTVIGASSSPSAETVTIRIRSDPDVWNPHRFSLVPRRLDRHRVRPQCPTGHVATTHHPIRRADEPDRRVPGDDSGSTQPLGVVHGTSVSSALSSFSTIVGGSTAWAAAGGGNYTRSESLADFSARVPDTSSRTCESQQSRTQGQVTDQRSSSRTISLHSASPSWCTCSPRDVRPGPSCRDSSW